MASVGRAVDASRITQGVVSALSTHFSDLSLDQNFSSVDGGDIESLFRSVLQLSEMSGASHEKDEVSKWISFANDFLANPETHDRSLSCLNEHLSQRAVLLGGLKTSEVDVVVFSALHSFVSHLFDSDIQKVPHVIRWMDYIQNKEDFGGAFETIAVKKPGFQPHKKTAIDGKISEEKKKVKEKELAEKDAEVNVTVLNIQVGLILKAWKHPSADSLLVEEIDLGDGSIRQVVSGLAKYFNPEDIVNRHVVLITNVKPGKLRDVTSFGLRMVVRIYTDGGAFITKMSVHENQLQLIIKKERLCCLKAYSGRLLLCGTDDSLGLYMRVLCASNEDHSIVEPLIPPEGARLGERVLFSGYEGKPEDVLNPKKKQLDKITPHLCTDDKGVATFKGVPFMTSAGPCTSNVRNASIK